MVCLTWGTSYRVRDEQRRAVRKEVNGVLVNVAWVVEDGKAVLKTAYPVRGKGVMKVRGGKLVTPTNAFNSDEFFSKVRKQA